MSSSLPLEPKQPPQPEVFEAKHNLGFMLHSPLRTSFEEVLHHFAFGFGELWLFFANGSYSAICPQNWTR